MKRLLLVVLVAAMLVLAGCADGAGTDTDESDIETDGSLEDADSNGAEDDTAADSNGAEDDTAADEDDTDSEETTDTEADEPDSGASPDVDGELEIHHIDVGQADATLLIDPSGETMLIDSGDWRQGGTDVIDYLEDEDVDRIDHLVATHAHADHIGGHDAIIEHYETERDGIGAAYDSGVAHTSQTYERYLDAIEDHDVELLVVEDGDHIEFGDATIDVRNPPAGDSESDLHYNSVALAIEFGEFSYLTTGDAEADAEQRMVDEHGAQLESDAYQAGHHGSTTSSTTPFMDQVAPDVAVISSAYDSQYGHPHDEVLEDYADRDIETYWTAVHGDVVLTTDGSDVELETEHEFSTDASELLEEKPADDDTQASLTHPIDVATAPLVG
ncbi:beta-lactamase domain protein (plasmid) [Natrialba magadii ATCC 43099]|uniref:Beta-lactamase n=1 Tax=Natrialba magadii (strain ATCC 43099 / DSM 3394 / CCM 3739 / CIP 104546 / IAM 13178 / JCM 8861 / NBRC 102185 / NCIMB 2190 / MS3) TaxID=547559 RepID=D3T214_NATMM|nr:ComEC/Rec2 family competence protein [Natrialba magadii]ADD07623.1 beta-lactamase domain protein [Natrialba magadii ATCC 43099]ELY27100.1 beta-lactamase [Natrialba magadii ATCC 43099]